MIQKKREAYNVGDNAYNMYIKWMTKVEKIKKKKTDSNSWTKSDFKIVNMSLKRKSDEALRKEFLPLKDQYNK